MNVIHMNRGRLSKRLYVLLLSFYPQEFKREYGREMAVVFADRYRAEAGGRGALLRVWCEALLDLVRTVPRQHFDRISEGGGLMRIVRTIVLALLAYAFALLVAAPLYVRNREAMPGFVNSLIDATIATGVLFNLIFLVLTLPRLMEGVRAVRAALILTTLILSALITFIMSTGGPPAYHTASIVVAQALSILIWFSVHLWWVRRRRPSEPTAAS